MIDSHLMVATSNRPGGLRRQTRDKQAAKRRPWRFESLEQRRLLTATPGWEFRTQGNIESTSYYGYDMALASDGTVYTHSSFSGTADFDPSGGTSNLTATPGASGDLGDGVVARYGADRELLWARRFGGSGREYTRDIAIDSGNNAYIIGTSYAFVPADFGNILLPSNANNYDLYVAKIDANGNFVWAHRFGGMGSESALEIDIAPDGTLAIGVGFTDSVDFDPGPGVASLTSHGSYDAALLKLDADGNFLSVTQFGGIGDDSMHSVAHDLLGNIFAVGVFADTIDFGGSAGTLTNTTPGTLGGFLLKVDASNVPEWVRPAYATDGVLNERIAVSASGDIVWSTSFRNSLDFGPGTPSLAATGAVDLAIVQWNTTGDLQWAKQIGGTANVSARDHVIDANGQILIPGWFTATADFDPGVGISPRTSVGGEDAYLLTLDATGAFVSVRQAGGSLDDRAYSVASDTLGNAYVSGNFRQSAVMFNDETLIASTYNDFFLVKMAATEATKYFVVDGSADRTHEFDAQGNRTDRYALATGNTSPRGAVSNLAGNRVWVLDANKKVFVYDDAGLLIGSWTANGLSNPQGIATNGSDIWIVDSATDRIYRYGGAATRTSGSQSANSNFKLNTQNSNPTDVVTDGMSIWVINDAITDKVFKYSLTGSLQGSWSIDTRNSQPTGITINPANVSSIYILDNGRDQIFEYIGASTQTTGSLSGNVIASIGFGNFDLQGLADPPPSSTTKTRGALPEIPAATIAAQVSRIRGFTSIEATDLSQEHRPQRQRDAQLWRRRAINANGVDKLSYTETRSRSQAAATDMALQSDVEWRDYSIVDLRG